MRGSAKREQEALQCRRERLGKRAKKREKVRKTRILYPGSLDIVVAWSGQFMLLFYRGKGRKPSRTEFLNSDYGLQTDIRPFYRRDIV